MLVSSVVYLTCFNRILNLFQSYTELLLLYYV